MEHFDLEQIQKLSQPLAGEHIANRSQAGRTFSYIESHHAIREANRIFGFDGWTQKVLSVNLVQDELKAAKSGGGDNHYISYTASVEVTAGECVRQDVGFGQGIDRDQGQAHESAIKEAISDACKRCLRTFGDQFGLALYDKDQEHVDRAPKGPRTVTAESVKAPLPPGFKASHETAKTLAQELYTSRGWTASGVGTREKALVDSYAKATGWYKPALILMADNAGKAGTLEDLVEFVKNFRPSEAA